MPYRAHPIEEHVSTWVAMLAFYLVLALAGALSTAWPISDTGLNPGQQTVIHAAGAITTLTALACFTSQFFHRWRVEMVSVWFVAAGVSVFASLAWLAFGGPERGIITALLSALLIILTHRGLALLGFETDTRRAKVRGQVSRLMDGPTAA